MGETSVFYYIKKFAGPEKKNYTISIVLAIVGVVFSLIPFLLTALIVTNLIEGQRELDTYIPLFVCMTISWILHSVFSTLSTNLSHKTTFKVLASIRLKICNKLARMPLGSVQNISSGSLKNMIVERVDSMETTLAHIIPEYSSNICAPIIMFIFIFVLDWRMALLSLATLPVGVICLMLMMRDYAPRFKRTQDSTKALNSVAVEYIQGIEVIKAFGKVDDSSTRFKEAANENALSFIEWMGANTLPFSIARTFAPSAILVVLPLGALFTMQGSLSLTNFIIIIILSCSLIEPILALTTYEDDIRKISSIFGEIDNLLDSEELSRPETSKALPASSDIVVDGLSFSYDKDEILHNISFNIPAKSFTALVGPSGSGKSTIVRLIASLWDAQSGFIKIGNIDVQDISLNDFYSQIAYVSQDTFLFNMSVKENIRLGNPSASDEEVYEIARQSGCYEFIVQLEDGFNTIVGSGGAHLSGGEQQRISIARAMLKNAPILIFDEATAYADPENEAIIQKAVARLAQDKTLIAVAHRLSTIINADQILLVNKGQIEDRGTHEELLQSSELYSKMWHAHISARDSFDEDTKGGHDVR